MAEITAAAVMALRNRTDLPMMRCKKALIEADGDEEKAIEILKSQVKNLMSKRQDNETKEGRVFVKATQDNSKCAMVRFECETAPVAGSPAFMELGEGMVTRLLEGPGASTPEELLDQEMPGGTGTIRANFEETINKIGEKFVVQDIAVLDGPVGIYVHHDGKTGAVFQAKGDKQDDPILRDVAMHIAAMKPKVTLPEEVDPAEVEAERARLTEEAKASGKPDNIVEKIVDGKMKVFYQGAGVLVKQPFAKEESKTVEQVLKEAGFEAVGFKLMVLGE